MPYNTDVVIPFDKYKELHKKVEDPILGTTFGAFKQYYNCWYVGMAGDGKNNVLLIFASGEDAVWFQLKHL